LGGRLSLLVLDEAWIFLRHQAFADKIVEWLKVLRKKNVFVVFATQDVADVEKSPIKTTIIQQCLTKIYLADPSAATAGMIDVYRAFGLSDSEISLIAGAVMKRDYFYTSPLGRRLFQLDLGPLTLALIGTPDHRMLDDLSSEQGPGLPLCRALLERQGVAYTRYLDHNAPEEPTEAQTAQPPVSFAPRTDEPAPPKIPAADILDAAAALGERRKKGQGRAAETLALRLGVSPATVYQARKLLKHGGPELIEQVRRGELTIKKASKSLSREAGEKAG
jgi:hypothetical protein